MKNRILAIVAMALLAVVSVSAQNAQITKVNVPFTFQAGDHQMPAGTYVITYRLGHTLRFDGPGVHGAMVMVHPEVANKVPATGYLSFYESNGRYYLKGLWQVNEQEGIELYPTRAVREILKAKNPPPALTTLALNEGPTH